MDWTNVAIIIIPIVGSGLVTWLINRRKDGASVQLIDAQTDAERKKTQAEMQRQIDSLFDELTETRGRIRALENDMARLEDEVNTLTRYLRRVINQLRKAEITPDLPPEVIEQLFKGTEG